MSEGKPLVGLWDSGGSKDRHPSPLKKGKGSLNDNLSYREVNESALNLYYQI